MHDPGLRLPRPAGTVAAGRLRGRRAISPDSPARLAEFAERRSLTYQLLSDPDRAVLTAWGAYGEKKLYGKTVTGVIRSTVVLDPQGVVTWARYNVKATGHVAMLTRELGSST